MTPGNKSRESPSLIRHLRDIIILPFTVTVVIPYFIHDPEPAFIPDNLLTKSVGVLVFLSGLSLFLYTVYLFKAFGRGTLAPWDATQKLVIRGPYRYCRNPMITGVFFILIGETLFLHSTNLLIWIAVFFLINTMYFILKEEPDLQKRFGGEYEQYKAHVPRWIPKFKAYSGA